MRKYIGQVNSENFIYPNNTLAEYDVEIVHDINNNSVSGTTTGFSAIYNAGTGNIGISFTYIWNKNNAEPFIDDNDQLHVLSVHMSDPSKKYYKPWRMISGVTSSNITATTVTDTFLIIVTPAQMGLTGFTSGVYDFEIRFIGKRAIYPICQTVTIPIATPTPSPTPGGPTFTPTPSGPCYCYQIVVTGTTGGEGGTIAVLDFNNCYGVRTSIGYTVGPGTYKQCIQTSGGVVQYFEGTYGIDTSYLTIPGIGNCNTGYVCSGYTPNSTPTPTPTGSPITATPTNTPTSSPITATPTATPTSSPITATPTATPTATTTPLPPSATPTPSPTATPLPDYTYLVACSGGSIIAYILGSLTASQQVSIGGNCYVTTYTTTNPTEGTEVFGTVTYTSCCPTPTPTPTPVPVGVGIISGTTHGSASASCLAGGFPTGTVYIANGDTLSDGDVLYTLPGLTSPFNGNSSYYRLYWNSTYYAATVSSFGIVSNLTNCSSINTPTPTPTPSPTPTETPSGYNYYNITRYNCPGCSINTTGLIGRVTSPTSLTNTYYYNNGDGYVYLVISGTGGTSYDVDLDGSASSGTNCSGTCGI